MSGWTGVILWPQLCGSNDNDSHVFWDFPALVNTSSPDLPACFQQSVVPWVWCGLLWACLPPYALYLCARRERWEGGRKTKHNIAKIILALLLLCLSVADLVFTFTERTESYTPAQVLYVDPAVRAITYLLSVVLIHATFSVAISSSGILFCFWFLQLLLNLVQFRSRILDTNQNKGVVSDPFRFSTFYASYGLALISLLLECFSDVRPEVAQTNDDVTERTPLLQAQRRASQEPKPQLALVPCPEETSPFLSRITHWWITPQLLLGYKRPLVFEDMTDILPTDKASALVDSFSTEWGHSASLVRALLATCWGQVLLAAVFKLLSSTLEFVNPLLLGVLITWVSSNDPYAWKGYVFAVSLLVLNILKGLLYQLSYKISHIAGLRIRTTLMAAVYRKSLRLSNTARKETTTGEIINLISVDADMIYHFIFEVNELWSAPIMSVVAMYMLWMAVGPSCLAGLGLLIVISLIIGYIGIKFDEFQNVLMEHKDMRLKKTNEFLSAIKVLKLYAWEPSFTKAILDVRNLELKYLLKMCYLGAGLNASWGSTPVLTPLCIFFAYVLSSASGYLDPQTAFVTMNLAGILTNTTAVLPLTVTFSAMAYTSMKRIRTMMQQSEIDEKTVGRDTKPGIAVSIDSASFSWGQGEDGMILKDIDLKIPEGHLVAVVGTVGSGKSSLLSAMIGELPRQTGRVDVKGSVAYIPQEAWIQNATLRSNIVFDKAWSESYYHQVVEVCALTSDLKSFPAGDQTEIGEKGINLSGGQKQRVSLARGVYQNNDIYLLDDPLSAVDAHVGKHIFDKVIGPKGLLKRKTRVLVTHSVKFLPQCDIIVVLRDGCVSEVGGFKDLLRDDGDFAGFLRQYMTESDLNDMDLEVEESTKKKLLRRISSLIEQDPPLQRADSQEGSEIKSSPKRHLSRGMSVAKETDKEKKPDVLIEKEVAEVGAVSWSVVKTYILSASLKAMSLAFVFQLLLIGTEVGTGLWISDWTEETSENQTSINIGVRLGVYATLGVCQVFCLTSMSMAVFLGGMKASRQLHAGLLQRIARAPMAFFDTTPLGRIINRFSSDMENVDGTIVQYIEEWFINMGYLLANLVIISYSTPVFVVVPIGLAIFYLIVQRVYISTIRQMKRLNSIRQSPIYTNLDESLVGVTSVRAYHRQQDFIEKNDRLLDNYNRVGYPIITAESGIGLFLDVMGSLIVFFAALFAVLARGTISSSVVGLSVNFAMQTPFIMGFVIRSLTELETNIVSVERIKEYSEIETEAAWDSQTEQLDDSWPSEGSVEFSGYSTRYRSGLDKVLRDVTFNIKPGEKVGVAGRTGAGKSSVTLGLFRILEPAGGRILVDGVDITTIGLHDLRGRLTIIPQDPVLFATTLRRNLDPFESYSDDRVWEALDMAHLKTFVSGLEASLSYEVGEGGQGLSVGQRQLVCLARALLRHSKVLVLDEATAAVDLETDELIQDTIQRAFKDSTVITIAHRLNTIMDYDRVMVLEQGEVREFDSPGALLMDPSSLFYSMAKQDGKG